MYLKDVIMAFTESNAKTSNAKRLAALTDKQPYGNLISDKINQEIFQAATVSVLLYGHTTWTLTK